jgi:dipeptidyl-peptidase-4
MNKTLLPFVFILSLFAFSLSAQEGKKKVTLDEIWHQYKFYPKTVRGIHSLDNGKEFARIKNGSLVVYDYKTGDSVGVLLQKEKLVPEGDSLPVVLSSYKISDDGTKFLIPTQTESIYRHSKKSVFYIYDTRTNKMTRLSENRKQRLASFNPAGDKVAFVRDNNIFIKDLNSGKEKQITFDGKKNEIINGTCDWVYEEEFGFTKAFFWSPDGKNIAYYRFDESKVKEYTLTYYGTLYPKLYTYKYPKAGEANSVVEVFVYNVEKGKAVKMDTGEDTDIYIPRIKWTKDPEVLAVERLNRLQNHLDILLADAATGETKVLYNEDNPYYIDITDDLTFLPDNKGFLITSEKDGYNHIYFYDMKGEMKKQLTSGEWDVTKVYGYDAKNKKVYYQSAESSPLNRDVYVVNLKGKRARLNKREGTNSAQFSSNFEYYINTYSNANTPPYITMNNNKGDELRVLEDNDDFVEMLAQYDLSEKTFSSFTDSVITLPDGKQISLNIWQIMPPDFDSTKKYPVLLYIYGGPGAQTVLNSWDWGNYFWFQMLAENGIIVVSVDNRGTGARGQEFKKMTYLQLGKYENIDHIAFARYLGKLPYVDKDNIGVFGWSYGGFMSSLDITKGAGYFSTAIAVAPVTNWRYYDNIYTERFMRTPQENPKGYDSNSPINHVDKLKGNYLLVHGSTDDNVHFQNSMDMITALVNANKQFRFFVYPNKNHGIYGGNTRYHLYKMMTDFLYKNLKGMDIDLDETNKQ